MLPKAMCGDNLEQEDSASTGLDIFKEYPFALFIKKELKSFFALSSPPVWKDPSIVKVFLRKVFLKLQKGNKPGGIFLKSVELSLGAGSNSFFIILCQSRDHFSLSKF